MVEVELEKAGSYKVLTPSKDGSEWAIVKMDDLREGPDGGLYPMWEPVRFEPGQGWIAGECWPARTLRQARKNLAHYLSIECGKCHGTSVKMDNVFEDCPCKGTAVSS